MTSCWVAFGTLRDNAIGLTDNLVFIDNSERKHFLHETFIDHSSLKKKRSRDCKSERMKPYGVMKKWAKRHQKGARGSQK